MQTTVFSAPAIQCGGCANAIKKALGAQPGVSEVAVDIESKSVTVIHAHTISRESLKAALDKAGFPVAA